MQIYDRRTVAIPGPVGPQGPEGKQGLPGVNALDNDAAVAAYIADGGSQTHGQLSRYLGDALEGPLALGYVAAPFPGSRGAGNLKVGAAATVLVGDARNNAFPSMVLCEDGSLLVVWRQADSHDPTDIGVLMQSRSRDLGRTWSVPDTVVASTLDVRDPGVTRLSDGRLVLQYRTYGTDIADQQVYLRFSSDHGVTWGEPRTVPFTFTLVRSTADRPIELEDGTLLVTGHGRDIGQTSTFTVRLLKTTDDGQTWSGEFTVANGVADNRPYTETQIGRLRSGNLLAMIRADVPGAPALYTSESLNDGASWSPPRKVIDGSGRPSWIQLASGALVVAYRRLGDWAGVISTSWDEGTTWVPPVLIHEVTATQSVYAQPVEISPGLVAIAFADETSSTEHATVRFKYLADGRGVTPLGDVLFASREQVSVPATSFIAITGSPTLGGVVGIGYPGCWNFDPATVEAIAGYAGALPEAWATFDVVVRWTVGATTSGNVMWQVIHSPLIPGQPINASVNTHSSTPQPAPGVVGQVREFTIASRIQNPGQPLSVRVVRAAAHADDTFPGDAMLLDVILRRSE